MSKSNKNYGKIAKVRVLLDLLFFVLMILVLIPQSTGIPIHEWLSFIILIPFFLHLLVNWKWIANNSKKAFKNVKQKSKFDYFFNWFLYLLMLVVTVSGIVISEAALPVLGIHFKINAFWTVTHNLSATLFMAFLGVHLALHWTWIVQSLKKLKLLADLHHLKQILTIVKKQRKALLLLLALSVILSLGIWWIEYSNWAQQITLNSTKNTTENAQKPTPSWLLYVLPLVKVTVFITIPALLIGLVITIKKKFKK
ncbi:DUF4405 domain-containing protein [Lacinutrix undariae]